MKNILFFHAFIFLLRLKKCRSFVVNENADVTRNCPKLHVEILVSPLGNNGLTRRLEIQWENAPMNAGDWIGLLASDPLTRNTSDLLEQIRVTSVHGWTNTSVYERHSDPENLGFHEKCLNYYAGYFNRFNEMLAVSCLRTEPNWMWNLKTEIGPRSLRDIFLPGTHDSAAYGEYDRNSGNSRIKKYSITQDESILGQLIYGIRYIDLRVGYYPRSNEPWWANHAFIRIHPLRIILKDIRTFLKNTNEIVILDVQEFPVGFNSNEVHFAFVELLKSELGDLTVPPLGWDSTVDQIWNTGKKLIIGYDKLDIVDKSNFLWNAVQQKWGNVQSVSQLYAYLEKLIKRPPISIWSAMAELTPTPLDIAIDRLKGLRMMAESVNHNITEWYRRKNWQLNSNIVTVDFFRNTGIIRSAIEWNKYQGKC